MHDNSDMQRWKVSTQSNQFGEAPNVIFFVRPPDAEAINKVERLNRHLERVINLSGKKHMRMRQNMIFATLKVGLLNSSLN